MTGTSGASEARITRFARFRCTAFPTVRPAETAKRDISSELGRAHNTISGWAYDFPNRRTRLKSVVLVRRNLRFTAEFQLKWIQLFQLTFLTWLFFVTVRR